ncbi:MAG: heavy-metal-associated protein [Sediminibacterium sp.]|nr:heavy-metal-associated protein [Sediminibacterium sp.]
MTHTYTISGMTCTGCQRKVQELLVKTPGVTGVTIDLPKGEATVDMRAHVPTETLKAALKDHPKYQLSEAEPVIVLTEEPAASASWLVTYKPILLIFGYILTVSVLAGGYDRWETMRLFMAGFFLVFSFFKLLDLQGFADSYSMYDIVAKKIRGWGYIYPFVELGLGIAFVAGIQPIAVNIITLVVMSVSIIGVLQSVFNKRKIKCACLGAVFNLPMSTITIIEDALMIAMSVVMLIKMV